MSFRFLFLTFFASLLLTSCSTISKKDCTKNMKELGLAHGKSGSPKKYTDDLRDTCFSSHPSIDLESYEKGFYQGWMEFCLPNRAFDMGKKADRYISFCPAEREALFREKYLLGKHHFELKDVEEEITSKMDELKSSISSSSQDLDEYNKLQKELEKTRREIQAIEVEGAKNSFSFR